MAKDKIIVIVFVYAKVFLTSYIRKLVCLKKLGKIIISCFHKFYTFAQTISIAKGKITVKLFLYML